MAYLPRRRAHAAAAAAAACSSRSISSSSISISMQQQQEQQLATAAAAACSSSKPHPSAASASIPVAASSDARCSCMRRHWRRANSTLNSGANSLQTSQQHVFRASVSTPRMRPLAHVVYVSRASEALCFVCVVANGCPAASRPQAHHRLSAHRILAHRHTPETHGKRVSERILIPNAGPKGQRRKGA